VGYLIVADFLIEAKRLSASL